MIELTGKQKRYLRGLGHHLQAVVMVGRGEVSPALIRAVDEALAAHELIKVKLQEGCDLDRHEVADTLSRNCGAAVAQVLGKTLLLYRPAEDPVIQLP
ncbi:MAG: ribosome assembly RNA-binding protein YhbY [Geothermobacteraceae bacterium]|nr:MAG: ribosome assembly RNA-binding protein YhbY [Deltaproteobacteria bacterium]